MAISLSCPSCDRGLKVKDELAGRRIKCPGCGKPIAVPDGDDESEAITATAPKRVGPAVSERNGNGAAKKKSRPRDEEEDKEEEEDRPRKKKKKKKDRKGLLLLLLLGGGALAVLAVVLFFVFTRDPGTKKEQAKVEQPPPKVEQPPPKIEQPPPVDPGPQKKPKLSTLGRIREAGEIMNTMKQLGLAYHNYFSETNRAPKTWEDLSPHYGRHKDLDDCLKNRWIVFYYNVTPQQMREGSSKTILAYEADADNLGIRYCVMGDGSVQKMGEQEFNKAPKGGGSK
jgi:hypothetical protein